METKRGQETRSAGNHFLEEKIGNSGGDRDLLSAEKGVVVGRPKDGCTVGTTRGKRRKVGIYFLFSPLLLLLLLLLLQPTPGGFAVILAKIGWEQIAKSSSPWPR